MNPDVMTLPMTPQAFWVVTGLVGVLGLSALVYWALSGMGKEHRPPIWEELPKRGQGTAVFLCLLWLGLFGLTIVAAYLGVWEAIHPKDAGSQPNLGLGALLAALLPPGRALLQRRSADLRWEDLSHKVLRSGVATPARGRARPFCCAGGGQIAHPTCWGR